jgi:hypothetical protein
MAKFFIDLVAVKRDQRGGLISSCMDFLEEAARLGILINDALLVFFMNDKWPLVLLLIIT